MDIQGKIIFASEVRGGVSQRSSASWQAQDFVIETHEQYPKKCCFTVFGEDRLKQFNLQVGEEVTVSVDIDAHEYQGRWFNDIRAWRVQRGVAPAGPQPAPASPYDAPVAAAHAYGASPVPGATPVNPVAGNPGAPAGDPMDDLPF